MKLAETVQIVVFGAEAEFRSVSRSTNTLWKLESFQPSKPCYSPPPSSLGVYVPIHWRYSTRPTI